MANPDKMTKGQAGMAALTGTLTGAWGGSTIADIARNRAVASKDSKVAKAASKGIFGKKRGRIIRGGGLWGAGLGLGLSGLYVAKKKAKEKSAGMQAYEALDNLGMILLSRGDWKAIHQRERSQAEARKWGRRSAALAGLGAATAIASRSDAPLRVIGVMAASRKMGLKPDPRLMWREMPSRGKVAAIGGGAALAGLGGMLAAKGVQAHHQRKINRRRKSNFYRRSSPASEFSDLISDLYELARIPVRDSGYRFVSGTVGDELKKIADLKKKGHIVVSDKKSPRDIRKQGGRIMQKVDKSAAARAGDRRMDIEDHYKRFRREKRQQALRLLIGKSARDY